jgi:hypothetical protein
MTLRYKAGLLTSSIDPSAANPTPSSGVAQFNGMYTPQAQGQATATNTWVNDSTFKNNALLIHGDGKPSGSQNNTFLDSSGSGFAITRGGTATQGTFSPYGTGWSNYFVSTNFLYCSNAAFSVSAAATQWTYESWVYVTNDAYFFAIGSGTSYGNSMACSYISGKFGFSQGNGSSALIVNIQSTLIYQSNNWYHYAVSKDASGNIKLFINGTVVASTTNSSTAVASGQTAVICGVYDNNGLGYNGISTGYISYFYCSNSRFVTGAALYTSNFTPSTDPLGIASSGTTQILTCQSNRFIDNSSTPKTFTVSGSPVVQRFNPFPPKQVYSPTAIGGSVYLGGVDYLSFPGSGAVFGTGPFTIECWAYPTSFSGGPCIVDNFITSGASFTVNQWQIEYSTSGQINFSVANTTTTAITITTTATTPLNAWTHIAVVRTGYGTNQTTVYINGVASGTGTYAQTIGVNAASSVGRQTSTNSYQFLGYIDDVRLTPLAVYNGNFTPPTAPLSNTQLANANASPSNALTAPIANSSQVIFNGTNQYLTLGGQSAFAFGSGAFTIEFWFYLKAASQTTWFCDFRNTSNTTQPGIGLATGYLNYYVNGAGQITGAANPSINTWHHLAVVKNGSSTIMYLNGVQTGSTFTDSVVYTVDASRPIIGAGGYTVGNYFNGYISNFRIVKGTAVYTSAFTPPTSPLTSITNTSLLTCQNPTIIDNSSNAFTITNNNTALTSLAIGPFGGTYAGLFNGSSQYLTVSTSTAFNLGSATAWTMEAWVYTSGSSTSGTIIEKDGISGSNYPQYSIQLNGSGYIIGYIGRSDGVSTIQSITSSVLLPTNAWVHIAFVLNSGTLYLYQNGVQVASASKTVTMLDSSRALYIGYQQGGGASTYFSGYISNARLVNGTAVYTSNFFPAQSPLTAITNTSLLTCQNSTFVDNSTNAFTITNTGGATLTNSNGPFGNATTPQLLLNNTNAGVLDNAMMNDFITVGSAQVNTSVKKYGSGSISFSAAPDYLYSPVGNNNCDLSTGDFTVETWVNFNVLTGTQMVAVRSAYNATAGTDYQWSIYASGTSLIVRPYSSTTDYTITVGTIMAGVWYHVAFVRFGNVFMGFLNGVRASTTQTISGALNNNTGWYGVLVGNQQISSANQALNGYVDELRVTKGLARYTANFIPPQTAFSNQ